MDRTALCETVAVMVFLAYWLLFHKTINKVALLKQAADRLKQCSLRSRDAPPMSKQSSAGQVDANKSETVNSTGGSKNGGFTERV